MHKKSHLTEVVFPIIPEVPMVAIERGHTIYGTQFLFITKRISALIPSSTEIIKLFVKIKSFYIKFNESK